MSSGCVYYDKGLSCFKEKCNTCLEEDSLVKIAKKAFDEIKYTEGCCVRYAATKGIDMEYVHIYYEEDGVVLQLVAKGAYLIPNKISYWSKYAVANSFENFVEIIDRSHDQKVKFS